jgi:hypothetical protein
MTRSKTSSRPLDCALEIVDELNIKNRIGTMASISHRLCKFDIVFLAARLSMAEVDAWNCNQMKLADTCFHVRRLALTAPLCAKHHASGSGAAGGFWNRRVSIRRLAGYFSMFSEHREDVATAKSCAACRQVVSTQSADRRPRASDQDQLID